MSTRYLIAALLMTSACAAQADVLPTTGTDGANSLVQALYGKTSADQAGTANLSLSQGVDAPYVIGTSNTIMAAMLGYGMSVFNTRALVSEPAALPATGAAALPAANPIADTGSNVEVGLDVGSGTGQDVGSGTGQDVGSPLAEAGDVGTAADGEVPEPSSIALMMAGMLGAAALGRRRRG